MNQHITETQHKIQQLQTIIARYESALELIATPKRPDGTYNRCREACEQIAKEALKNS
jgi:hypothetical protein